MTMFERFGTMAKQLRLGQQETLRSFCNKHGFDAGNISKIERGRAKVPQSASLTKYAQALGLVEGSEAWRDFFDLASLCHGQVPQDLLTDAQLALKLPLLFKTLRRSRGSRDADLLALAELIRRA